MPLTQEDYDFLGIENLAGIAAVARALPHDATQSQPEPQLKPVPSRSVSVARKKAEARLAWIRVIKVFCVIAIVGTLFGAALNSYAKTAVARSVYETQTEQLEAAQRKRISLQTQIAQKYSLNAIRDYAENVLHMKPIEGGRMVYITANRTDKVLDITE
ncbi:MAG: hypothetical protein LBB67_01525 [Oscillospiraceae bacterium]|nr:hypothetical protein [Oscillospiraceae bacterium]